MKSKSVLVIGILLVFCLVSCTGSRKSALVGKWVAEGGWLEIEFFKDGSVTYKEGEGGDYDEVFKGTWEAKESGQLILDFGFDSESFDYKISGSVLTLDNDVILKKK
jgi:hypothetical protein